MPRDVTADDDGFDPRDAALLRGVATYVSQRLDALEAAMVARMDAAEARFNAEITTLSVRTANVQDGQPGPPGPPGERGEQGERGANGLRGWDGSLGEVRTWREGAKWAGLGVAYQHRGGLWMAVADPEGAEPGTDDRWRCVANGIDAFNVIPDVIDARRMTLIMRQSDGTETEFAYRFAIPLHRGLWEEGAVYEAGDVVARNGASLICVVDTATTPPGEGDEWRLMSARGKPGSRGDDGKRGPPGPPGHVAGVAEMAVENGHLVIHQDDGTALLLPLANGEAA